MTADDFRRIALGLEGAIEGAHMGHPDFRINNRIFATLRQDNEWGMVVLLPEQQVTFVRENPGTFVVEGDRVVLTATTYPSEWHCGDGLGATVVDARWQLADGKLTLTAWKLSPTPDIGWFAKGLLGTKPLERVDR